MADNKPDTEREEEYAPEPAGSRSQSPFGAGTVLFFVVLFVAVVIMRDVLKPEPPPHTPAPMPTLLGQGWLNVNDTGGEVVATGKPVVLDAWATWCGPCRAAMPRMVRLHEKYGDRAQFIGLTSESAAEVDTVAQYIESVPGFVWPVAYGADPTLSALGVTAIPTLVLYNAEGMSVWRGHDVLQLDEELEKLVN